MIKSEESNNLLMVKVLFLILQVEYFERLKETGEHIDFETSKCMELPDLEEDVFTGFGGNTATSSNWRTNNAYEND